MTPTTKETARTIADEPYDIRTEDLIKIAVTEAFGERCPDFAEFCPCCQAWAQYDRLMAVHPALTQGEEA